MLLKYVNIPVFILSLAIGLFLIYIYVPEERSILVYPTPENAGVLQYRDATGNCFHFKQEEIKCPEKESEISKMPAQA